MKTEKQLFTRNVILNLIGQSLPMLAAFFSIPILIQNLGTDRFGILTIAWVLVGYFSLFDMGLGRALTKLVAETLGQEQQTSIPRLIWTALALMGGLGLLGAATLMLLTPWLIEKLLKIPDLLQHESRHAFYILTASIPFVIITTGLRGVLEAYQRFDIVNAIRMPMGFFTFCGPLIVLPFSKSLPVLILMLVLARVISFFVHMFFCYRTIPFFLREVTVKANHAKKLLSFGSWMMVSNIVGPIMLYIDRFYIANMISITDVTFYTTPYEIIIRVLVIPTAILGVMFPAFSTSFVNNFNHIKPLYHQTIKYMAFIMIPIALFGYFLAKPGLSLWIDPEFALSSFRVAQILIFGVFINSFGHISQSLIQASGRPDITAKLHLFELPLYLIYLQYFLSEYGIEGAALAWLIRVSVSTLFLTFLAKFYIKAKFKQIMKESF